MSSLFGGLPNSNEKVDFAVIETETLLQFVKKYSFPSSFSFFNSLTLLSLSIEWLPPAQRSVFVINLMVLWKLVNLLVLIVVSPNIGILKKLSFPFSLRISLSPLQILLQSKIYNSGSFFWFHNLYFVLYIDMNINYFFILCLTSIKHLLFILLCFISQITKIKRISQLYTVIQVRHIHFFNKYQR